MNLWIFYGAAFVLCTLTCLSLWGSFTSVTDSKRKKAMTGIAIAFSFCVTGTAYLYFGNPYPILLQF